MPPYDFNLSCRVLSYKEPMPEVYEHGAWKRAINTEGNKLIPLELQSTGSVDKPKIEVKFFQPISKQEKKELEKKLDELFSFSQDLASLYSFMDVDPILNKLKQQFYGLKAGSIGTSVFEHIVKSIIQQQISIRVAFSITNKMVINFGQKIIAENSTYYDFPTPIRFSEISLEEIQRCGVSWTKAECIKEIAEKTVNGEFDPESLRLFSNEQILQELTKFCGIGVWTAEMVLSAGLKRDTTVPAGDLGVRRTVSKLYSKKEILKESEIRKIAKGWGEFTKDIVCYISCIERT